MTGYKLPSLGIVITHATKDDCSYDFLCRLYSVMFCYFQIRQNQKSACGKRYKTFPHLQKSSSNSFYLLIIGSPKSNKGSVSPDYILHFELVHYRKQIFGWDCSLGTPIMMGDARAPLGAWIELPALHAFLSCLVSSWLPGLAECTASSSNVAMCLL